MKKDLFSSHPGQNQMVKESKKKFSPGSVGNLKTLSTGCRKDLGSESANQKVGRLMGFEM